MKTSDSKKISSIIKTAIISAFTLAAAFIWKDVIMEAIQLLFPPNKQLFYMFLAALIATFIVVIAIYVFLKTESKAEEMIFKLNSKK